MSPKAVFIGMPGVGKSSVGRMLAQILNVPFADSDILIKNHEKAGIERIFATKGETYFRQLEEKIILENLAEFSGVLSLGGGAVDNPRIRSALLEQKVFLIDTSDEILLKRITNSRVVRPLLKDQPEQRIKELRKKRMPLYYEVSKYTLISDNRRANHLALDAAAILTDEIKEIQVSGDSPYKVVVGNNLSAQIVNTAQPYQSVLLLHDGAVKTYTQHLKSALLGCEKSVYSYELPSGEAAKDLSVVTKIWDFAGDNHLGRDAVILAIGGGTTTDVAGFVASTWLRGIPIIQVPTTLLAMVDAAIGGKTGINTKSGKNLVGTFYPPLAVFCVMPLLDTLPIADLRAGLAEIIKCGFIGCKEILDLMVEARIPLMQDRVRLMRLIELAIKLKAKVVSQDLKESGLREILNYGHTLAHAIEKNENYAFRHGEAVAIGCVFAAALAEYEGIAVKGILEMHKSIFANAGLPISYSRGQREELLAFMRSDKKVRADLLRFVVLSSLENPLVHTPSIAALNYAFDVIGIR